jgi:hypothetical protein
VLVLQVVVLNCISLISCGTKIVYVLNMNEANFVLIKIIHISTYAQKSECQHLIRWTLVTTLLSILQHGTAHDGHVVGNEIVHTYLEPFRYPSSSLASCANGGFVVSTGPSMVMAASPMNDACYLGRMTSKFVWAKENTKTARDLSPAWHRLRSADHAFAIAPCRTCC